MNGQGKGEVKQTLIAYLNSYTAGMSGGDIRFIQIAKRLSRNGVSFEVVTSKLGEKACRELGLGNAEFKITTTEDKLGSIIRLYLRRILLSVKLGLGIEDDVVLYVTSDYLTDVVPSYCVKRKHGRHCIWIQLIHHVYDNPFRSRGQFLANALGFLSQRVSFKLINKQADAIITVSTLMRDRLAAHRLATPILVNGNGVSLQEVERVVPSAARYDLAFLGRLNRSKGVFDLIDIMGKVKEELLTVKLAVIGGGDKKLEKQLREEVERNGLEQNIDLLGYLNHEDALGVLRSSKVFVFPSCSESFGIAVLEAMSCRLPVVTYDLPVYRHLFEKGTIRVPLHNTNAMADSIVHVLTHETLRQRIAHEAKEESGKHDWDVVAEREYRLIEDIVSQRERR